MTIAATDRQSFERLYPALESCRRSFEALALESDRVPGFCRGCRRVVEFSVAPGQPEGQWRNLLEGMVCPCGLNGRMRLILKVLDAVLGVRRGKRALVLERMTPLFPYLLGRVPGLIGAEFLGPDLAPGTLVSVRGVDVRHQDMMQLSYADKSLDLLMHFDVLEHIPDTGRGLAECARVLSDDGILLFSCPFYHGLERNIVRAACVAGNIEHYLPPAYHGNPIDGRGSLVFIHPSWELIPILRHAGFDGIQIAMAFDPIEGILSNGCPYPDGHMWPAIFVAAKSEARSPAFAAGP